MDADGNIQFVYDDRLAEAFADEPDQVARRASFVEPYDGSGGTEFAARYAIGIWWTADLSPCDGPVLGPFRTRAEALQAERQWLRVERWL